MINSYLLEGKFAEKKHADFKKISESAENSLRLLEKIPLPAIIELLSQTGSELAKDKKLLMETGVGYISLWLRSDNLRRMCRLNYDNFNFESFAKSPNNYDLIVAPRGVACHWIAGNMPTLGFFSVVLSLLSKNASVVKVFPKSVPLLSDLLKKLSKISVKIDGREYFGRDLVSSVILIFFDQNNSELNKEFSISADLKIVWGGKEAVQAIKKLPEKENCQTIVFGPKYSFAVFDRQTIESEKFEYFLTKAAEDSVIFNQMACSSPHVIFFEKSKYSISEIGKTLSKCLEKLPERMFLTLPENLVSEIVNARTSCLFENNCEIIKSKEPENLKWTIIINNKMELEEPVRGRCIFIKEIKDIKDIIPLATHNVQAVGIAISNEERRKKFASEIGRRGVDRLVLLGKIHHFDLPWDGMFVLNRMVRFISLKDN